MINKKGLGFAIAILISFAIAALIGFSITSLIVFYDGKKYVEAPIVDNKIYPYYNYVCRAGVLYYNVKGLFIVKDINNLPIPCYNKIMTVREKKQKMKSREIILDNL
jgi:hypothetical protein